MLPKENDGKVTRRRLFSGSLSRSRSGPETVAILIMEALYEDARAIALVLAKTWLHAYPNAGYGITQEDIQARFYHRQEIVASIQAGIRNRRKRRHWVARENAKVIASCMAYHSEDTGHIGAMYVLPDYQGRGIGTRLMKEALARLGKETEVTLWAAVFNPQPIAFYKRFGFVENGVTRDYDLPNEKFLPLLQMVKRSEG
jgi:ribosomal protein S18 acetylase RimI-like enzyme